MIKEYINKKNIFGLFLGIFFLSAQSALALEVQLPGLPNNSSVAGYTAYFFGLGVYMAIFIAAISFTVGAVTLIMSAGNASLEKEAKDRMKSSHP